MAEHPQRRPEELETAQRRLAEVEEQVGNLVEALSRVRSSTAIEERLRGLEEQRHRLQEQVGQLKKASPDVEMPTLEEIRREIDGLAADLSSASTPDLREMITDAVSDDVAPPRGKKRPWSRLRFRVDGLGVLRWLLDDRLPPWLEEMMTGDGKASTQGEQFSFEFGRRNRLDELAPRIAELRRQGLKWVEIPESTGLRVGTAHAVLKRWAAAG